MTLQKSKLPVITIIGGGAAGLELATRLGNSLGRTKRATIKLIDYARTHVWKPLYHQVAAGILDPYLDQIEYFSHAKKHSFQFYLGRLQSLDRNKQILQLAANIDQDGNCIIPIQKVPYDILVLAVGSIANDFGIPGVAQHCHFLDTLHQATCFSQRFIDTYLQIQTQTEPLRPGQLKIVIVGTGATGVELAAELHRAIQNLASYCLDRIDKDRQVQIVLIGGSDTILPGLPTRVIEATRRQLEQLGIQYYTGEWVNQVTDKGVKTKSGLFIDAEFVVWAGGIKAPDFLAQLDGLESNKLNQLVVTQTLQTTLDFKIFALGDCSSAPWKAHKTVPPRAQAAHQQAKFMERAIEVYLAGKKQPKFSYKDYGSLVSLGKYSAVGNLMGTIKGSNLFIEGYIARCVYLALYKRHQAEVGGVSYAVLASIANIIAKRVKPRVKLH